jgi:hypothetical protein
MESKAERNITENGCRKPSKQNVRLKERCQVRERPANAAIRLATGTKKLKSAVAGWGGPALV